MERLLIYLGYTFQYDYYFKHWYNRIRVEKDIIIELTEYDDWSSHYRRDKIEFESRYTHIEYYKRLECAYGKDTIRKFKIKLLLESCTSS